MRKIIVAAIAAISLGVAASPAAASHSWNGYHWARTANPFALKVGNNLTADWVTSYRTALSDWSASSVLDLTEVAGGTTGRKCRATLGRVEVCNAAYGNNGWLGLASISISSGHITQGTAKMNDTYFSSPTYNNPNERLHVMCQEIGHDFGLGHTSEDGSSQNTCMDYFSNTGANATSTQSTRPNQHDYDQIAAIYAHTDASTTIASSPAKGPSMADRSDSKPYAHARKDSRKFSVLTEKFADGSLRMTHWTWAD